MSEPQDNPADTPDEEPVAQPQFGGDEGFNGSLMSDLREQVEQRIRPILDPEPDPRLADMSEEERDVLAESQTRYQQELADLQWQNELLQLAREKPREAAIIERMGRAQSLAEMVEALAEASGDPELQVADVDRNNPPSTTIAPGDIADLIRLPDGRLITRDQGIEMLRQADSLHG